MSTVAIMQPSFLGWAGYYALIDACDVFILDDLSQFVRKSWHSRNRIRDRAGKVQWLTVPVHGHRDPLHTIRIDHSKDWGRKHLAGIEAAYAHTPGYELVAGILERAYSEPSFFLTGLTRQLIEETTQTLGIETPIRCASEFQDAGEDGRAARIVNLVRAAGADTLLDVRGAEAFLSEHDLEGIRLEWFDYEQQPYDQHGQEWMPHLSVIDCLCHCAGDSIRSIRAGTYAVTRDHSANRAHNSG